MGTGHLWRPPYARRTKARASLAAIGGPTFKHCTSRLRPRNLHVAIVRRDRRDGARFAIERLFAALPEKPRLRPVAHVDWKLDQVLRVTYPLPQTTLQLAYPGMSRDDPGFYAAYLMNRFSAGAR